MQDIFGSFKQKFKENFSSSRSSSRSNSPSESMRKLNLDEKPVLYYPEYLRYGETFLKFDKFRDHNPYEITIYYNEDLRRLIFSSALDGII